MSLRWGDRTCWHRGECFPNTVGLCACVANQYVGVPWHRGGVLGDGWSAVVIPVVGVSDIRALNIAEFDIKTVGGHPRVVHGIKIVNTAIGDACMGFTMAEHQGAYRQECGKRQVRFHSEIGPPPNSAFPSMVRWQLFQRGMGVRFRCCRATSLFGSATVATIPALSVCIANRMLMRLV